MSTETDDELALLQAWRENKCGDAECEAYRLKATKLVLAGGTTHKEHADRLLAANVYTSRSSHYGARAARTAP